MVSKSWGKSPLQKCSFSSQNQRLAVTKANILNSKIGESSHFRNASSPWQKQTYLIQKNWGKFPLQECFITKLTSSPWQKQKPVLRIKDEKVPLLLNGKNGKDYYCIYSKSQCGRWGAQIKGGAHEYQNKSTAQNPKVQVPPSLLLWREQLVLVVAVVGWLHCGVNHVSVLLLLLRGLSRLRRPPVCCCWEIHGCVNRLCVVVAAVEGVTQPR